MESLEEFNGTAPLFPLPSVALFPHVVQPLHMFEPRYRQMTADAVRGDGFLGIAVLKPGHEDLYNRKDAPIFDTVCLGKITTSRQLPDGRFNVVLQGLARARVTSEIEGPHLYRVGELAIVDDVPPACLSDLAPIARSIVESFARLYPQLAEHPAVEKMIEDDLPFGVLCDFITHATDIDTETAARVLCESDLAVRGTLLNSWLQARLLSSSPQRTFPPEFSLN